MWEDLMKGPIYKKKYLKEMSEKFFFGMCYGQLNTIFFKIFMK